MINFNKDDMTVSVDNDTIKRLTTGTDFQRSLNCLAMMDAILAENDMELLEIGNIPKTMHKAKLAEMAKIRKEVIKKSCPPGIDPEALRIFCE